MRHLLQADCLQVQSTCCNCPNSGIDPCFSHACGFEMGLIVVRNPFDAILAAFNHHKAGKTGEPDYSVFKKKEWKDFVKHWSARWRHFHQEWIDFKGPVHISCFEKMKTDLKSEVSHWLDFLKMPDDRLDCIDSDPVGQFYR